MFLIRNLNVVKMAILQIDLKHKAIKTQATYLYRNCQVDYKIIYKTQKPRMTKVILEKNKIRGFSLSDFKIFCKTTVSKEVLNWRYDRQFASIEWDNQVCKYVKTCYIIKVVLRING